VAGLDVEDSVTMICPNNADTKKSLHFTARGEEEEEGEEFCLFASALGMHGFQPCCVVFSQNYFLVQIRRKKSEKSKIEESVERVNVRSDERMLI